MLSNFVGLQQITSPLLNCISVADAKAHIRVFQDLDDSVIAGYLWTAMIACEDHTRRAFMPQTWALALSQWPGRSPTIGYNASNNPEERLKWNSFEVPKPPLASVVSFYYYDTINNQYSMTQVGQSPLPPTLPGAGNYILNTFPEPGEVQLPYAGIWPVTVLIPGAAIVLTYNCGFAAFAGQMNVSAAGLCTAYGSPLAIFDPTMAGTWITVADSSGNFGSYAVAAFINPTTIQLQVQNPNPLMFGLDDVYTYTANAVWMPIRMAVLFMAAHLYENREPIVTGRSETAIEIPDTIDRMLNSYIIYRS